MNWPSRYIGLPFIDGGRDLKGCDCWGLVRLVLAKECGIEVPSYGETSAFDLAAIAGLMAGESAVDPWRPVDTPQAFDVALMHKRRAPVHVGIMAAPDRLLHIEKRTDSVLLPVAHASLRFRSMKFFRHRALMP